MEIKEDFRRSMNWLHTWLGVATGGFLFVIFWMGSLSVFMYEIDQWMMPEKRIMLEEPISFDRTVVPHLNSLEIPAGSAVIVATPTVRKPYTVVSVFGDEFSHRAILHPSTGEILPPTQSHGASGFFYPFHYMLHISWNGVGYWIVGCAAIAMLALLVSGIFIHRKIFQDFFVFRPNKALRRSTLDLHNLSAVAALPFHILFPLTGITIMVLTYFPWSATAAFEGDRWAYIKSANGYEQILPIGTDGPRVQSIDEFVDQAEQIWTERTGQPARADYLRLEAYGDGNAKLVVQHTGPRRGVARSQGRIVFDMTSNEITQDFKPSPIRNSISWLEGAHYIMFDHWPLRWLYFLGGLAGSAMIATGLLFWMRARIRKTLEPSSVRIVRALTVGCTTGIIVASGVFLLMNRVTPASATVGGLDRAMIEVLAFYLMWILSFIHAAIRGKSAWVDQLAAVIFIALAAAISNWTSTGSHLVETVLRGEWAVAGVDAVLIGAALIAALALVRLRRTELVLQQSQRTVEVAAE